jgi:alpha-tubulin suppressor-like RCC1 family protein
MAHLRRALLAVVAVAAAGVGTPAFGEQAGSGSRSLQAGWIDAGLRHTCAILANGTATCWGESTFGELGDPALTAGQSPSPVMVKLAAGRKATGVAAGDHHSCAVLDGGSVACWGYNFDGQLGDPELTGTQSASPVVVKLPVGRRATAVTAGFRHSCAVLDDGSAACWGSNFYGQLGESPLTVAKSASPVVVKLPVGRRATAITAGGGHSCALLDNGSVTCWGYNPSGQLGDPAVTAAASASPVVVKLPVGRTATAVTAGYTHSCAILDDGSAACWGSNTAGGLGDPALTAAQSASPVVVKLPVGRTATAVTAGYTHSCAALDDGTAACWGINIHGQLGDPTVSAAQSDPVVVKLPVGRTATAITVGEYHSCALLDDGSASCWGYNGSGELGTGSSSAGIRDPSVGARALASGSVPGRVANVSLSIDPLAAALSVGQDVQVVVRVANGGPDPATGVAVTLSPSLLVVGGAVPSTGTYAGSTWRVGTVGPGTSAALVVNLTAQAEGAGSLIAEVTDTGEPDPNSAPGNHLAGEDDQKTLAFSIAPVVVTGRGGTTTGKQATRLTLKAVRRGRVLTLSGRLLLPAGASCVGAVTTRTRVGSRTIKGRAVLRAGAKGCTYSVRVRLPSVKRTKASTTVTFAGSTTLLRAKSSRISR